MLPEAVKTVYLASTLAETSPAKESAWFVDADTLGQKIFPLGIPEKDIARIFVKAGVGEQDMNLLNLLNRVKVTTQPFLLYSGMIGSGKTMALKSFQEQLVLQPIEGTFNHPDPRFHLKKRIIPYVSFRKGDLEDIKSERDVRKRVISVLINAFDLALGNSGFRDNTEWEINYFWDYMFHAIDINRFESEVFAFLLRKLGNDRKETETRYKIWNEIKNEGGIRYLAYLTTLFGYLRNVVCKEDLLNVFIIIDNIDQSSRTAQQFFAEKVRLFADEPDKDPIIILALRPETTFAKNERRGTSLIDFVSHISPSSTEVLIRRINYARDEGVIEKYFDNSKYEDENGVNKVEAIVEYLETISKSLAHETLISRFINGSSNGSIRLALWIAQAVLYRKLGDILSGNKDQQETVRACITRGKKHYKFDNINSHPIRNLFGVSGSSDIQALLIKSRILKFLIGSKGNNDVYLGDIVNLLCDIGYSEEVQLRAINELIEKPFPLVLSLGAGNYKDYDELFQSACDRIEITDLGIGYINILFTEMYYIQEVMFDTYVAADRFQGKYSDVNIWDRFNLLHIFLSGIIRQDMLEMENLSYNCSGNIEKMIQYLGKPHIVSYEIVDRVAGIIEGITERALKSKKISENTRKNWHYTRTNFEGLRNWAWQNNSLVFKSE